MCKPGSPMKDSPGTRVTPRVWTGLPCASSAPSLRQAHRQAVERHGDLAHEAQLLGDLRARVPHADDDEPAGRQICGTTIRAAVQLMNTRIQPGRAARKRGALQRTGRDDDVARGELRAVSRPDREAGAVALPHRDHPPIAEDPQPMQIRVLREIVGDLVLGRIAIGRKRERSARQRRVL